MSSKTFSMQNEVTPSKNHMLKIRCEDAVTSTGLDKSEFYFKSKIIKQNWYVWSWGLSPFPNYIKIRLCDLFGKPFIDFFLITEVKK